MTTNTKPEVLFHTNKTAPASGQCDCDCDCACASIASPVDFVPDLTASLWKKAPDASFHPVTATHKAAFNPRQPVSVAILNDPAQQLLDFISAPASISDISTAFPEMDIPLIEKTMRDFVYLGLAESEIPHETINSESTQLSAWLHITDRCNLRCAYCYLPHVKEDMTVETGKAAIDATLRSALKYGYKQVKLKYAGGEPLLRVPVILELQKYASELMGQYNITLDSIVLSNGTLLTEETIHALKAASLRLMISLDGLGESHDAQRFYVSGHGSSREVLAAIELAQHNNLIPDISITVSSRNASQLPELIAWVLDRNLPFSLNFYRENALSASQGSLALDEHAIIAGMRTTFEVIENKLPERSMLASIMDRANFSSPHLRTCSAGQDYLVFDQGGQVSKCQMQMAVKVTNAHADDPLGMVRQDANGLQNLPVHQKSECNTCEWRHWCAGGCPLTTHRATGRYDLKSPNCSIYKALYPEVLRLEGLRLLKYKTENSQ